VLTCLAATCVRAQRERGELQIEARDQQGIALPAAGELISEGNQFHLSFQMGPEGRYTAQDLAFGMYRVNLTLAGFAPATQLVQVRSIVPQHLSITLGLKPLDTQVEVTGEGTLMDTTRTSTVYTIGAQTIDEQMPSQLGRTIPDAVDAQPGWLYEANGVLNPRGSEYDVQYVIDGTPETENRSPTFAPPLDRVLDDQPYPDLSAQTGLPMFCCRRKSAIGTHPDGPHMSSHSHSTAWARWVSDASSELAN